MKRIVIMLGLTSAVLFGILSIAQATPAKTLLYSGWHSGISIPVTAALADIVNGPMTTPVLEASYNTSTDSVMISWAAVADAVSYDYIVGDGVVQSTTGTSVTLSGLALGTTGFQLRATNASGSSEYAASNVIYVVAPVEVVPAVPVLEAGYSTSQNSLSISWTAVEGATGYQYQLNGGTIVDVSAPTADLTGLVEGSNALQVRSVNSIGTSEWAASTVTFTTPIATAPLAPALNMSYGTTTDSYLLSWTAVDGALGYRVSINGGTALIVTDPAIMLNGLVLGSNSVTVVAFNDAGDSAAAATTVNYTVAPAIKSTHMNLKVSKATRHAGETAEFSGRLLTHGHSGVAGKAVDLYRSEGHVWVLVTSTVTAADGSYTFSVSNTGLKGSIRYRAVFAGDAGFKASKSNTAVVKVQVKKDRKNSKNVHSNVNNSVDSKSSVHSSNSIKHNSTVGKSNSSSKNSHASNGKRN